MLMTRQQVQLDAVNAIITEGHKGIVDVSPRVGKSKILIDSVRHTPLWKIAICSPYKSIAESWDREFEKWNLGYEVMNICTRSISKIPAGLDLLVVDEIQTLSDNQMHWISRKNPQRILGLTGTLSPETKWELRGRLGIAPIFTYTIEQAIRDGVISNFEVVLVGCSLDMADRCHASGTKKRPTVTTERGHYDFLTAQFEKFRRLSYTDASFVSIKDLYARQRMHFIYSAPHKVEVARQLVDGTDRCIVFAGRKEVADGLCTHTYHTGNKKENNLEKFIDGEIDKLGVINMVNMGVTIPSLKRAIIHQMISSSEMSLQKVLRICNLEDDSIAKIYVAYYKDTVDYKWTMDAFAGVDESRIRRIDESDLSTELSNP